MTGGKQRDIYPDILGPIEEENHPKEKQQVVVSGHHVFRPQVDEGHDVNARDFRDIPLVSIGDAVSKGIH